MVFRKEHNVVVMDATDWKIWSDIVVTAAWYSKGPTFEALFKLLDTNWNQLDATHPSIYVLKIEMGRKKFRKLQNRLDLKYPGLCCYDVAV